MRKGKEVNKRKSDGGKREGRSFEGEGGMQMKERCIKEQIKGERERKGRSLGGREKERGTRPGRNWGMQMKEVYQGKEKWREKEKKDRVRI